MTQSLRRQPLQAPDNIVSLNRRLLTTLKKQVKLSFRLRSENVKCDGDARAEAQNTCRSLVLCSRSASFPWFWYLPIARFRLGKTSIPRRCVALYGEEKDSVIPIESKVGRGLYPDSSVTVSTYVGTSLDCKSPSRQWRALISFGRFNRFRSIMLSCSTSLFLEGQQYHEALKS